MKLDCVLTAVNENKLYLDFIPIFIKTWNKLYPHIDVKIVLISKEIPEDLILYKNNIIIFKPIEDVLTSFTSQFIRLLYPCILDYKNAVLITDMDMLPMNSTYYTKNIVEFDNNKFIYYRDNVCFEFKEIAMCYNVATPIIWKDIFKVNSIDDIANVIKETFIKNIIKEGHGNTGWSTDQITLYNKIMEWNKKTNNFICLNEKQTLFNRLDRNTFDISNVNVRENITSGKYTDYHCYRPMSQYSKINWEIFNLLPSAYSKLPFIKSELKSPIGDGVFEIFINTKENILYKKKKKEINIINIENYKKMIYGLKNNPVLGEYIFEPEKIYIEDDGSYYSSFNKNSIRLYEINSNSRIDDSILDNLKRSIQDMKKKLNNYVKTNKLSGDWALHNLIYCLDTNKIYNIDLEGFYTYPLIHDNGNCDINYCNERFDNLLKDINLQEKNNDEYFTLILWNPTLFQSEKMLEDIPNIIEKKEIVVPKEFLHDYIFDIYKLDTLCSHNIVLPPKIKKLKEYNDKHLIVKFKIDNPQYTNNICNQVVKLKEMIRNKYNSNIKNYIRDIMIHIADNLEQSKYIWEKKIYILNMVKLFVQEAKNPLRYKLSKKDKNGIDGWNTINTMNVYENYVEGTIQYFVYRAANPRRYCLSMEKITDNNWEYYFDFYCKESEIDERIAIYKFKNLEDSKPPTINPKSLQEQCVYPFLENFIKKVKLDISLENLNINSSNNLIYEDIFIRKETWDHNVKPEKIKLFIDCIYDEKLKNKLKNKYYHITWGALTYYNRNVDKNILLKPLKNIYNRKHKFCDYIFTNKSYRNGKKRWQFFNILNNLKNVEQPQDNSRFSINMFNDSVELHKPYKFSIAFENDIVDGWVTEKIINSFLAGCIPIYDGTDDVYKYFNKNAFINAKNFGTLEELANYVIEVDNNPDLYNKYINEAPTDIEKLKRLFWWEQYEKIPIKQLVVEPRETNQGFFVYLEFVINSIIFCKNNIDYTNIPIVDFGKKTLDGGNNRYYEEKFGTNIFDYFFVFKKNNKLPFYCELDRKNINFWGMIHRDIGIQCYPHLNNIGKYKDFHLFYDKSYNKKIDEFYQQNRIMANKIINDYIEIKQPIINSVNEIWNNLFNKNDYVLGIHLRGTDKNKNIGGRTIYPEEYYSYIDYFITKKSAKLLVCSDDQSFVNIIRSKYNICEQTEVLRDPQNIFLCNKNSNYKKGKDVLIDSLLLSKCNFLLKCSSAVSEFSIFFNNNLHYNSLNLQYDCKNYFRSMSILQNKLNTHKECYNYILNELNINNIKFVIIRGFKYLPLKPDTDLDIIIHPDSYNKFSEIYSKLKNDNLIRIQPSEKYIENDKEVFYTPLFTSNQLKEGEHLPGNYYRFDTYSDLFFYKDGEGIGKNAITCNQLFKKYLFDNLIKIDNYYIPNPISEIILLIYRNLYDKRSNWSGKHINRINELLLSINKDEFNKICYYCFTSEQNIYEYLTAKEFNKINKPNQKLNLFIIRKKGMQPEIIDNILNQIENEYQILEKILININNKKKFYSNFYGNYDKHKDDIEKNNDNQCLAIITNNPDDINPNELKEKIRKQYIKFYPPLGNIIHSSDSSNDCEKELEMLFNENIDNFKNIGTYYSQKNI